MGKSHEATRGVGVNGHGQEKTRHRPKASPELQAPWVREPDASGCWDTGPVPQEESPQDIPLRFVAVADEERQEAEERLREVQSHPGPAPRRSALLIAGQCKTEEKDKPAAQVEEVAQPERELLAGDHEEGGQDAADSPTDEEEFAEAAARNENTTSSPSTRAVKAN